MKLVFYGTLMITLLVLKFTDVIKSWVIVFMPIIFLTIVNIIGFIIYLFIKIKRIKRSKYE